MKTANINKFIRTEAAHEDCPNSNRIINMKNKKAQHEIVGFVLIVLVVTIIGVIFLTLTIGRGEPEKHTSVEISNLLQSAMYFTTDCAINFIPQYREGQDLIKECYKDPNQKCVNGKTVCDVLKPTLEEVIDKGLDVGEENPNKAYKLNIYYSPLEELEQSEEVLYIEKGVFVNCSSITGGSHTISVSRFAYGTISIELEVCRAER